MGRLTGLWWWIDRWRKSTAYADMTLAEQGAYRNLLDEAHLRGGAVPNDERILAKACGDALEWKKVRAAVIARFELKPDGWHNETLDEVIRDSEKRAEKQRRYRNGIGNEVGNGVGNGVGNKVCHGTGNGDGNEIGNELRPPSPDPNSGSELRTPSPGTARARSSSIIQPRRKDAAWEGGRVYVPQRAHTDFLALRGPDSEPDLLDFYAVVDYEWTHGRHAKDEPGADMFRFWKAQYDAKWPATVTPKARPGQQPSYSGWSCPHLEHCNDRGQCAIKVELGAGRYPVKAAAVSA